MILYLEDWKKYPQAKIHINTKNKTFLNLAALYKTMGIKNHAFMLALINPNLEFVDPHDPDLSMEIISQIVVECKLNPWYFFREVARIPVPGSPEAIRFIASRSNIALYWLFFNHITTILVQIRQTGKSVAVDTLFVYLLNVLTSNTTIALLTKDDSLRSFNLERLKNIFAELPYYLNLKGSNDISNTEMLTVKKLGNEFRAFVPQKSVKAALNVGRGLTVPIISFDEAAFISNIEISAPAALAAGSAARTFARQMDLPYGTLFTTTAGKKDDRDGKFIYTLAQNSAVLNEKFFDAENLEDLEKIIRANSPKKQLRVYASFNHRQLGYTDAWLKKTIEEVEKTGENSQEDIERDFFNRWTSGSQVSPLPIEISERIRESQTDIVYTEISKIHGYVTRWYVAESSIKSLYLDKSIIMGIDSSDAVGGDDIAVVIRDVATGKVLAAGNYNETNLITFSEWLLDWFIRFPKLTLIIERRSTGAMILDYLTLMLVARNINPFTRIYNRVVHDYLENPDSFQEISKNQNYRLQELIVKYKKSFGFATSASGLGSRSDLYSTTLLSCAKYTCDYVHDKTLIDQILGLVIKNGRVDHEAGSHDDSCIAWLLSYWLMTQSKNLSFYGIDTTQILYNNSVKQKEYTEENSYDNIYQKNVKEEIDSIIEKLKKEKDDYLITKHENRLKYLYSQYNQSAGQIVSYDELIKELKNYRKRDQKNLQNQSAYGRYANYNNKTVFRI